MPVLTCRRIAYYSPGDEALFFEWLGRIPAVRRWEGAGDAVRLHVPARMSAANYRELAALYRRYRIDARPLARLRPPARPPRPARLRPDPCPLPRGG